MESYYLYRRKEKSTSTGYEQYNSKRCKDEKSIEDLNTYFSAVPAHIIVIMPEDSNEVLKEEDYVANCELIQNFQLADWERGLGVFGKGDFYLSSQEFREVIGDKKDEKNCSHSSCWISKYYF